MKTPVYIPSKGRGETLKTAHCFKHPHDPYIVIEPQDEHSYLVGGWKNLVILPENDQGIAYVRNWILCQAIKQGLSRYWMMDDDITKFFEYEGSKGRPIDGEVACGKAERELTFGMPNLGQGAMEYSQFSWSQKKQVVAPGYCDVAVLMFPARVAEIRYRPHMNLKEDRDFTLQVLNAGMLTGRAGKIAFAAPKNGSNAGGLSDLYAQAGREAEASSRMIEAWPGICEPNIKKDGRPDVKIHWKKALKRSAALP